MAEDTEPPRCPRCGTPMALMLVTPKKGDLPEVRSYGCQQCTEAMSVEVDPPPWG